MMFRPLCLAMVSTLSIALLLDPKLVFLYFLIYNPTHVCSRNSYPLSRLCPWRDHGHLVMAPEAIWSSERKPQFILPPFIFSKNINSLPKRNKCDDYHSYHRFRHQRWQRGCDERCDLGICPRCGASGESRHID